MASKRNPSEKASAVGPYASFGGLIGVLLSLTDNPLSLLPLMGGLDALQCFLAFVLGGVACGCLAQAAMPVRVASRVRRVNAGCVLAAIGMVVAVASGALSAPLSLFAFGGALFGAGLAAAIVRWACAFGGEGEHDVLEGVAQACLVAVVFKLAFLAAAEAAAWSTAFLIALGLSLGAVLPRRSEDERSRAPFWREAVPRLRQAAARNWLPASGLVLLVYISASVWGAESVGSSMSTVLGIESSWGSTVGFLAGALLLYALARKTSRDGLRVLYRIAPVVCVSLLLLAWLIGSENNVLGRFAFNIPLGCALAIMGSLLWVRLVALDAELDLKVVFGMAGACYALIFLVVFAVWPMVGDAGMSLAARSAMVVYVTAACAVFAVECCGASGSASARDFKSLGEERCRKIGEEAQLSPREGEILVLLAQGRSAPFIAEELFVSTNTVKTHIRRIYSKVGVHSKEELLDIVHGERGM